MPDAGNEAVFSPVPGSGLPFRLLQVQAIINGVPMIVPMEVITIADSDGRILSADRLSQFLGDPSAQVLSDLADAMRILTAYAPRPTVAGAMPVDIQALTTSTTATQPIQYAIGTTATQILAPNPRRRRLIIQNVGPSTVYLVLGNATPTATLYHIALAQCSVANDGTGAIYYDEMWAGAVQAIGLAAAATVTVTELS